MKLTPIPEENGVAVVALPTIKDAADMAVEVIRKNVPIGAVEILDEVLMGVINRSGVTSRTWTEAPTLFFKFSGTKSGVADSIEQVKTIAAKYHTQDFQYESDPDKQKRLWSARKEALWTMLALREKEGQVWSTDVAVPLSKIAELIGMFLAATCAIGDRGCNTDAKLIRRAVQGGPQRTRSLRQYPRACWRWQLSRDCSLHRREGEASC